MSYINDNGEIVYSSVERLCLAIQNKEYDKVRRNFLLFDGDVTGEEIYNKIQNKKEE